MTAQEIKIDPFGRPLAAYIETAPVQLSVLGRQKIERFSQIEHDERTQRFLIKFDRSAPAILRGAVATMRHFTARMVSIPVPYERENGIGFIPLFFSYADAVKAEQALLSAMMRRGEI